MKGKDIIFSDFLSRQKNNDSNPHEIIPISFNICQVLDDYYYNEKYLIQTRLQTKSSGTKLLEVHGMGKNLNPNLKPEKQHAVPKQGSMERPHIGQGGAGSRRKRSDPINQSINQPSTLSQKIPGRTELETRKTNHMYTKDLMHSVNNANGKMTNNNPLIPDVPFHPGPVYRPPPKPIKQDVSYSQSSQSSTNMENTNLNFNFEDNSPFQEGIMSKTFQRTDNVMVSKANIQHNKIMQLGNSMLMYGVYNVETLEKLITTVHNIHNTTSSHERWFAGEHSPSIFRMLYAHTLGLHHYSINLLLYLRTIQDMYITLFRELLTQLCTNASTIRVLVKGYLPNTFITPVKLKEIFLEKSGIP